MRIDDHAAGDAVSGPQHDIGGLARGAGNGQKFIDLARDLAAEIGKDLARGSDDGLGLVIEEARGAYFLGHFVLRRGSEILNGGVFAEQTGSHRVDALISALGGENGGYE